MRLRFSIKIIELSRAREGLFPEATVENTNLSAKMCFYLNKNKT